MFSLSTHSNTIFSNQYSTPVTLSQANAILALHFEKETRSAFLLKWKPKTMTTMKFKKNNEKRERIEWYQRSTYFTEKYFRQYSKWLPNNVLCMCHLIWRLACAATTTITKKNPFTIMSKYMCNEFGTLERYGDVCYARIVRYQHLVKWRLAPKKSVVEICTWFGSYVENEMWQPDPIHTEFLK